MVPEALRRGFKNGNIWQMEKHGNCIVWSLTSAFGGAGLSAAALCLSRIMSFCEHRKVLYLSFEKYPEEPGRSGGSDVACERLIMSCCAGEETDAPGVMSAVCRDAFGVFYLPCAERTGPLYCASPGEAVSFVRSMAGSGCFDLIVLDLPFYSASLGALLKESERVSFVAGFREERREKNAAARRQLSALLGDGGYTVIDNLFDETISGPSETSVDGQLASEVRSCLWEYGEGRTG